jgi:hypothetical protein
MIGSLAVLEGKKSGGMLQKQGHNGGPSAPAKATP